MASALIRKSCLSRQAALGGKCGTLSERHGWAYCPMGPSLRQSLAPNLGCGQSGRLFGPHLLDKRRTLKLSGVRHTFKQGAPTGTVHSLSPSGPEKGLEEYIPVVTDQDSRQAESLANLPPIHSPHLPKAWALFLRQLPKALCLIALCSFLLPNRSAWAANGATAALVRPAKVARYSLLAALLRLRDALGVASAAELLASAWTGLVAGCLHTLTGPDHLAALAPMSIGRTRLQSAWMGALWGCGHDAGQLLFGLLFLLLKDRLHMDLLSQWSGVVIGVTLCGIGALGLHESQQLRASLSDPKTEERPLTLAYAADSAGALSEEYRPEDVSSVAPKASSSKPFGIATFITGIFHGFQPDALIMILPALALPSKLAGLSFLTTFLLGTILAMGSYTAFIGASCEVLGERVPWINEKLSQVSSSISILVGIALISSNAFGFKFL